MKVAQLCSLGGLKRHYDVECALAAQIQQADRPSAKICIGTK